MHRFAVILIAVCAPLAAQTEKCCLVNQALASNPVEITGTVGQIRIVAGQGMPYFELKSGAETTRVYLGPMPYLIAENFNPKSGQEVSVKGCKLQDSVVAVQVTFVADKRTVKFRDERGMPLWRGGFGRGYGRRW